MIRLKHNKYPIWISFEGDVTTFDKVKEFIAEDISISGFKHYEAYQDIDEDTEESEANWVTDIQNPEPLENSSTKASTMTATIKSEDGTELSFGIDNDYDADIDGELPNDDVIEEVPNTEGKITRQEENKPKRPKPKRPTPKAETTKESKSTKPTGGLGKFADK
jgi:hypothetical protein|tara:strand:- start:317 stop:808 length:492 start_codon:yes stop_codon:yes gene_type:complete